MRQLAKKVAIFTLALAWLGINCALVYGEKPVAKENVAPGNCIACHKETRVLPETHPATVAMNGKDCQTCHQEGGKMSLRGKIPGSHRHQLTGLSCRSCHAAGQEMQAVGMEKCVTCHGDPATLAAKTAQVKPTNPHTSPHYGTDLDCNLCHHQHAKSENYCLQCHSFPFRVP